MFPTSEKPTGMLPVVHISKTGGIMNMRLLIVAFALAILVSSLASAQERSVPAAQHPARNGNGTCQISGFENKLVIAPILLEKIRVECGYADVNYPDLNKDVPTQLVNLGGKSFASAQQAVGAVLNGIPFLAEFDFSNKTITVKRDQQQARTAAPPKSVDPFEAERDRIMAQAQARIQSRRAEAAVADAYTLSLGSRAYSTEGYDGYRYSASVPYAGRIAPIDLDVVRDRQRRDYKYEETWGTLMFKKGTEKFFTRVSVWCGDEYIGGAADANNIWDVELLLPISCGSQLEMQYADKDGKLWGMPLRTRIVPLSVVETFRRYGKKAEGTRVVLIEDYFRSAHELKAFKQHLWVEQKK